MSLYLGIVILTAIANLGLGFLVLFRNYKRSTNIFFFILSLIFTSWSISNFLSLNYPNSATLTLFWIRAVMAVTSFLGPALLMFCHSYPEGEISMSKWKVYLLWGLAIICSALSFTSLVFSSVSIDDGISPKAEWGLVVYGFLLFSSLILAFRSIILKYKFSAGVGKLQLRYLIFGVIITFTSAFLTNFVFVAVLNISQLVVLGPSFSLVLIGFLSYAIVRHRLMDIRLAIRRTFASVLIIFVVLLLYLFAYFVYVAIYDVSVNPPVFYFLVLVAIITVFMFDGMQYLVRRITDRFLFSAIYDSNKLLRDLGTILSSTLGFEDVLPRLHRVLADAMHVRYVTFALSLKKRKEVPLEFTDKKGDFALFSFGDQNGLSVLPHYLEKVMQSGSKALLYDDLIGVDTSLLDRNTLRLISWMSDHKVGVLLPLTIKGQAIGYVVLGEKMNGDAFTSEDVSVLETFGLQAAIGIENILLFMYTQDFNKQLKSSVDRATGQLKEKNKTLELLRKMDSIITTTLDLQEVSQKVVDTLSWELGYDITYLSLLDKNSGKLVPSAAAHTPVSEKATAIVVGYEKAFEVDVTDMMHPIAKVFRSGERYETVHLSEVFAGRMPDEILKQIHKIHQIRGVVVYPVFARQQVIGTLLVAMPVEPEKQTLAEKELLEEFVKEVGIALDNAILYEEVKRTNQALIDTNKKLIELDRMKDEFVSIASHELRTPMTAINSYVWMALNKAEMSQKAKDYLQKVALSTQRLIDLVNDMLNVSRIESGRIEVKKEPFDVVEVIRDVVEELQIKAGERHLELSFNLESGILNHENMEKVLVVGDANKVREVVTNFVGNSLKFTEKGKVWLQVDCGAKVKTQTGVEAGVEVSIYDTGRGVAKEDMERLFTKFGRLENELSTIAQTQGTGLGLFICKKYMEAMGGEVGVESELGKGSRFWFRLRKAS